MTSHEFIIESIDIHHYRNNYFIIYCAEFENRISVFLFVCIWLIQTCYIRHAEYMQKHTRRQQTCFRCHSISRKELLATISQIGHAWLFRLFYWIISSVIESKLSTTSIVVNNTERRYTVALTILLLKNSNLDRIKTRIIFLLHTNHFNRSNITNLT